jgi:hypothetical protein
MVEMELYNAMHLDYNPGLSSHCKKIGRTRDASKWLRVLLKVGSMKFLLKMVRTTKTAHHVKIPVIAERFWNHWKARLALLFRHM